MTEADPQQEKDGGALEDLNNDVMSEIEGPQDEPEAPSDQNEG